MKILEEGPRWEVGGIDDRKSAKKDRCHRWIVVSTFGPQVVLQVVIANRLVNSKDLRGMNLITLALPNTLVLIFTGTII